MPPELNEAGPSSELVEKEAGTEFCRARADRKTSSSSSPSECASVKAAGRGALAGSMRRLPSALTSALTKRALPSLEMLSLANNPLGDAGLAALLPALRRLPPLKGLSLLGTNIGDEGVASLVAQPTAGALKSLELLRLDYNQITDAGCATLASALRGGTLPALKELALYFNPASEEAQDAVQAALDARSA